MRQSDTKPWNSARATLYGALIGGVAAAFKLMAPWSVPHSVVAIADAALAFALLCGVAAALRNFAVRRLVGTETGQRSTHRSE
jgi:hypothetical protein